MYPNQTQAVSLNPPLSGSSGNAQAGPPRDPGALGMAANRLRGVNDRMEAAITRIRTHNNRIAEAPGAPENTAKPTPPPAATVPGLLREVETAESLIQVLHDALQFLDAL